jgi:hypothetical protein
VTLSAILLVLERILLTLWVGGLWVTGLVFAPVMFGNFERQLAGDVAGHLFTAMSRVGLLCGAVLLAFAVRRAGKNVWRDWRAAALGLMLVILLVGEYGIAARMRELKLIAILEADASASWAEFGRLHGLSSALYLADCLVGLLLVVKGLRPRAQEAGPRPR